MESNEKYCNFMQCDYRRAFGLMTRFIELFDKLRDYTLHFIATHALVPTVMFSLAVAL
jgi:hypothetical protein